MTNLINEYIQAGIDLMKQQEGFIQAIELKQEFVDAYYNRGNVYAKKGLDDKAIKDFGESIYFFEKKIKFDVFSYKFWEIYEVYGQWEVIKEI